MNLPRWIHFIGYLVAVLLGSSGEFMLGMWDRLFPENQPPIARMEVMPNVGDVPLNVTARASDSSDPEGGPLTYIWSINGKSLTVNRDSFQHNFKKTGTFALNVEVKDEKGLVATNGKTVTVREKFDLSWYLGKINRIERWIHDRDYSSALAHADEMRYSCDDKSIASKKCAQLHAWAAEAQLFLDRYDEGYKSINAAARMEPNDVFHVVFRSQFLLLRNEPGIVITELTQLASATAIGARGELNLAIAHAMMGDYANARAQLGIVLRSENRHQKAAKFAQLVTGRLEGLEGHAFGQSEVIDIVCLDKSLNSVLANDMKVIEVHVFALRVLVTRLNPHDREMMRTAMEGESCI